MSRTDASRTESIEIPLTGEPERHVLGRLVLPDGQGAPAPLVMLVHGYKSPLEWGWFPELQERLASVGLASVAFIHSHSGLERTGQHITDEVVFGRNTYSLELEDLTLVRDWVAQRPDQLDATRVGLYGYSRGGGMAVLHAAERGDYAALVLWAPMARVLAFEPGALELWRTRGWTLVTEYATGRKLRLGPALLQDVERNRERLEIPAAAGRLRAPVLLVGAERDAATRPESLSRLTQAFPAGLVQQQLLPGVGHSFGFRPPPAATGHALVRALELTVDHFAFNLSAERRDPGR